MSKNENLVYGFLYGFLIGLCLESAIRYYKTDSDAIIFPIFLAVLLSIVIMCQYFNNKFQDNGGQ